MAGGFGGDLDNSTAIEGSTDGQGIGNVGDRLKVESAASVVLTPSDNVVHFNQFLLNGSNNSMDVNGSSTNQIFEAGPGASETWFITHITIFITDGGDMDYDEYGSLNDLTNGLLIEQERNGTDHQIANLQDNCGLVMTFNRMAIGTDEKSFMKDDQIYVGSFDFKPNATLFGSTNDVIKATVRDNLNGLSEHKMTISGWKII